MHRIVLFMKRNYKLTLLIIVISIGLWSFKSSENHPTITNFSFENIWNYITNQNNEGPEKDKLLIELITSFIARYHYDPATVDDEFSKGVYKDYINALDPTKVFFLESDIKEFSRYENKIDDLILTKDLSFFELTYKRRQARIKDVSEYYQKIVTEPFDYKKEDVFNSNYDSIPYAKNAYEIKDRWRKQLKLSTLSNIIEKEKLEKEEVKTDSTHVALTFEQIEKEARETTKKSMDTFFERINELERKDIFSLFLNAITQRYDPHTYYFAPEDKDRFDISMSGKLEGIGARLQKEGNYTEVTELISGGPAWRGQQLEAGDIILKVAQGTDEPVDIMGQRLDDVVKIIKGPKGTEVRLTVKKVDGRIEVISIIRDIVEIEETYVKSTLVKKDGKKYGLINLPKFYIDFTEEQSRNAATDMKIEIERLKKQHVEGIIIDLRGNGGGSLKTVVDIGGFFIDQGPIVQIKSSQKKKEVLSDTDPSILWDGPLVIMVNEFSASASEILAAAVQDYKRGVVIGSKQTYGKGTVQNIVDLNQVLRMNSHGELGALKTTTQKFYRISGGSTQLEGVKSDIVVPGKYSYLEIGEKDISNPMPWDKIDAAPYQPVNSYNNTAEVIKNSNERIKNNPTFQLIDEEALRIKKRSENYLFNLQIDSFKAEDLRTEEIAKKYKAIADYKYDAQFESLPYEQELIKKDTVLGSKRDRWHENLAKDIYVEEAIQVLTELKKAS
ncbi:MAG: carboxy terminal-processing peptidase [Flavobacteriales bacterium]|nr:carboxy terminal-processing peptidase [Flavobacteriales bacterium]